MDVHTGCVCGRRPKSRRKRHSRLSKRLGCRLRNKFPFPAAYIHLPFSSTSNLAYQYAAMLLFNKLFTTINEPDRVSGALHIYRLGCNLDIPSLSQDIPSIKVFSKLSCFYYLVVSRMRIRCLYTVFSNPLVISCSVGMR